MENFDTLNEALKEIARTPGEINEFVTEAKDTDVPNRVSIGGDAGTFKYNVPSDYTLAEGNAEASYK